MASRSCRQKSEQQLELVIEFVPYLGTVPVSRYTSTALLETGGLLEPRRGHLLSTYVRSLAAFLEAYVRPAELRIYRPP